VAKVRRENPLLTTENDIQQEHRSRLHEHLLQLGKMQVDAELMYHNRSSVITVALGMLAVAFVGLATKEDSFLLLASATIAFGGLLISILWFLMEQRNQVYFTARGAVIIEIEAEVARLYSEKKINFPIFWARVPEDVKKLAKPYQRVSAPLISRTLIPIVFCMLWGVFTAQSLSAYSQGEREKTAEDISKSRQGEAICKFIKEISASDNACRSIQSCFECRIDSIADKASDSQRGPLQSLPPDTANMTIHEVTEAATSRSDVKRDGP
jgi:hypothetical protein